MNLSILTLIMLAPAIGAVLVLLIPREKGEAIKMVAAATTGVSLLLSFYVFLSYDRVLGGFQFEERSEWITALGITYHVGVDGFSAPQLLLTGIVGFCAVLVTFKLNDRPRDYFAFLLSLISGVFGAFIALDAFLMLIFYELVLFPVYVLVAGWGSKNREYAAMKLTIYLFLGSLAAIIGLLYLYFQVGAATGTYSFDWTVLQQGVRSMSATQAESLSGWFPFLPIFIGFGVLASLWPLHNWSPDGYAAAPTSVSMLHGGVLKATGAYCALRFGIQLLPDAAAKFMPFIAIFCVAGLIYAAAIAFKQNDLKYIIGFSSVSHLGLVLLGLAAMNTDGLNGAGIELFAGGVMTGLMFSLVGMIYERSHIREVDKLNGLARVLPLSAVGFVIGALTLMGMPGLPGFIAEIQIFKGLWAAAQGNSVTFPGQLNWWYGVIAVVAVLSVVINAAWTLRVAYRIYFTDPVTPELQQLPRLDALEKFSIGLMCAVLLFVGVVPNSVMALVASGVRGIMSTLTKAIG